jgi:hypothetical protein
MSTLDLCRKVPHARGLLAELAGELIELTLQFEKGHSQVVGRVRVLNPGYGSQQISVGDSTHLPINAQVSVDATGVYYVYDCTK